MVLDKLLILVESINAESTKYMPQYMEENSVCQQLQYLLVQIVTWAPHGIDLRNIKVGPQS